MATEFESVFFPTDFSNNAKRALPFAAEIAARSGAKLVLFHASQEAMDFSPGFEKAKGQAIKSAEQQFEKLIDELKEKESYSDLEITMVLQSGHPVVGLLEQAADHNSDLIVMGTKGSTGDGNVIFGSVTSGVINKSKIPVLAVPDGSTLDCCKNITFATDYHEGDFNALEQAVDFAALFDSRIEVIHVAERENLVSEIKFRGFRDLVRDRTEYENIDFSIKYDFDFFPVMADYLIDHPNSLLVMVRYKKTFWEKLVERDHSKEMAFYSRVPLLVLIGKND